MSDINVTINKNVLNVLLNKNFVLPCVTPLNIPEFCPTPLIDPIWLILEHIQMEHFVRYVIVIC